MAKVSKKNPKADPELVKQKREEIQDFVKKHKEDIETKKIRVFFIDECHLLWGNLIGYLWGDRRERVEVPISNEKDRQTYFGALDAQTQQVIVRPYATGNSENTIDFIRLLQKESKDSDKLVLIWDGASYHKSKELRDYLSEVNGEKAPEDWSIHCMLFAPNAPAQNPIEKVWLQGKNWLRKLSRLCKSFAMVKELFQRILDYEVFDFTMLEQYGFVRE